MPPSLWALSTLHGTCVPERPSLPLCPAGGAYTHPPARKCTWAREHTPAHKCTPCPLGPRFPAIKGHVFPRPSHPWACRGPPSPCTCLPHAHDTDRHPRGHTPTALSFPRRRRGQRPPHSQLKPARRAPERTGGARVPPSAPLWGSHVSHPPLAFPGTTSRAERQSSPGPCCPSSVGHLPHPRTASFLRCRGVAQGVPHPPSPRASSQPGQFQPRHSELCSKTFDRHD